MTQYNTLNVKLSNSQLNKLKLIGSSNDETNFQHKLLLTDTQVSKIRQAFANGSSANITFSKTQLFEIVQLGGFIPIPSVFGSPISKASSEPSEPLLV